MATVQMVHVLVPRRVEAPRAAQWLANFASTVYQALAGRATAAEASPYRRQSPTLAQHIGYSIWHALEDIGRRRASSELYRLARHWQQIDPDLARQMLEAARGPYLTGKEQGR